MNYLNDEDRLSKENAALRESLAAKDRELALVRGELSVSVLMRSKAEQDCEHWKARAEAAEADTRRVGVWEAMNRNGVRPGLRYDPDHGYIGWEWSHRTYARWRDAMDAAISAQEMPK